jgi:hypothetical protein
VKYLVIGSEGPGFSSSEDAGQILEEVVLPSFDRLIKLEAAKKILAGGLPVGDRSFVFIMEAPSNEALDEMLRDIPMWGSLQWEVTPLQTLKGRAEKERRFVKGLRKVLDKKGRKR